VAERTFAFDDVEDPDVVYLEAQVGGGWKAVDGVRGSGIG
jgi:hypothetical protein